jgi:hypothetical protein
MKFIKNKISERFYLRLLCMGLRLCAWLLLACGVVTAFVVAGVATQLLLLSRWSGVVVLTFFIMIFLFVNLVVHIAWMVFDIKHKTLS